MLKRTALFEEHRKLSGRLIDFGGWELPVQYSGILDEHLACRSAAGLFDVSHMGEFHVEGSSAEKFLNSCLMPGTERKCSPLFKTNAHTPRLFFKDLHDKMPVNFQRFRSFHNFHLNQCAMPGRYDKTGCLSCIHSFGDFIRRFCLFQQILVDAHHAIDGFLKFRTECRA